jgi:hypothetical protein
VNIFVSFNNGVPLKRSKLLHSTVFTVVLVYFNKTTSLNKTTCRNKFLYNLKFVSTALRNVSETVIVRAQDTREYKPKRGSSYSRVDLQVNRNLRAPRDDRVHVSARRTLGGASPRWPRWPVGRFPTNFPKVLKFRYV